MTRLHHNLTGHTLRRGKIGPAKIDLDENARKLIHQLFKNVYQLHLYSTQDTSEKLESGCYKYYFCELKILKR